MAVSMSGIRSTSAILVPQGGTGNSELVQGGVLVGQGTDPVNSITGSDGQVLTWVSGTAVFADSVGGGNNSGGLSTVYTTGSVEGDGSSQLPVTLKENISLTSVTASFKGDGSQINNLSASQIDGLNDTIDSRITNISNNSLQNSSITINGNSVSLGGSVSISTGSATISGVVAGTNMSGGGLSGSVTLNVVDTPIFTSITADTGSFSGDVTVQGNLYVNGSQTYVNTTDLTITDNVILIASGAANAALLDGAGIHFGRLPSEDARIIYDSVNDWMEVYPAISSSVIRGTFIGDGSNLTGINDASIKEFSGSGFQAALSGALVLADYSDTLKSNAFGVVSSVSGSSVFVKMYGEATTTSASLITTIGTPAWVGPSGSVVEYSNIPSGKHATQVGYISDTGKIIIQPRVFGQKA
jgi:hypothetical protein